MGLSIGLFFSCLAMVANFIVIVIIFKKRRQRTSFDLVIASLSTIDFSASVFYLIFIGYKIGIVFLDSNEIRKHHRQSDIVFRVTSIFFFPSLMHVLHVTFLRFFALFWPMWFRQIATKAFIKALIAATWTLSLIGGIAIIKVQNNFLLSGIIAFASCGLVFCAYVMIAVKIYILSKNSQSARNKEHRVLLNSFGVAITFFGCMLPYACLFYINQFCCRSLVVLLLKLWLSKRDEMRRIRNNAVPKQSRDEVLSDENHV